MLTMLLQGNGRLHWAVMILLLCMACSKFRSTAWRSGPATTCSKYRATKPSTGKPASCQIFTQAHLDEGCCHCRKGTSCDLAPLAGLNPIGLEIKPFTPQQLATFRFARVKAELEQVRTGRAFPQHVMWVVRRHQGTACRCYACAKGRTGGG